MGSYSRVYWYAGITFIAVGVATGKIAVFLPIGIALIVVGMLATWRSRTLRDSDREERSG